MFSARKSITKWLAIYALFSFASFSTGATQAAWQISDSIEGNKISTGVWEEEPVNADETIVITGNTSNGENELGWMFNRDASTQSPYEFNTDTASVGAGALFVEPIQNNINGNKDKFIAELFLLEELANFNSISYDFQLAPGTDEADEVHYYMNVYANFGENPATKFYDCRYDIVPNNGVVGGWATMAFDPTQPYPVTKHASSLHDCPSIPAEMNATTTGATIRVIAINVGDTSPDDFGVSGYLDKVVLERVGGTTTYDFEPEAVESEPEESITADIVLNEFLPRPDGDLGSDNSDKPLGEWVELYNNEDDPVSLDGWYITDASGGVGNTVVINAENASVHLVPETTVIPAKGFLVVYMNKSILNNPGDSIYLYDSSSQLVDSVDYGVDPTACENTPTPGEENEDNFDEDICNASNVPANKSFARIPDGIGDWIDPVPTPGTPNILDEESAKTLQSETSASEDEGKNGQGSTLDSDTQGQTLNTGENQPVSEGGEMTHPDGSLSGAEETLAAEGEQVPEDVVKEGEEVTQSDEMSEKEESEDSENGLEEEKTEVEETPQAPEVFEEEGDEEIEELDQEEQEEIVNEVKEEEQVSEPQEESEPEPEPEQEESAPEAPSEPVESTE